MKNWISLTATARAALAAVWIGCGGSPGAGSSGAGGKTTGNPTATTAITTMGTDGSGGGFIVLGAQCNPVTNAGCAGADACDIVADSLGNVLGFGCYPPPNNAAICSPCAAIAQGGPFCAPGGTCFSLHMKSTCARYCCTDADCGPDAACDTQMGTLFGIFAPDLGLCVASGAPDGGAATSDGGAAYALACNAPATALSNGSCVTVGM
jgi:hypothetical protein